MAGAQPDSEPARCRKRRLQGLALVVGLACLVAMIPVTLGSFAGLVTLGGAVPVLGAAMGVAALSLVVGGD